MKGEAHVYRPGDSAPLVVRFDAAPPLEFLQEHITGYIEPVPFFTTYRGRRCVAFCDEEGKRKGLAFNDMANRLWASCDVPPPFELVGDVLVGPVVILFGDSEFMAAL